MKGFSSRLQTHMIHFDDGEKERFCLEVRPAAARKPPMPAVAHCEELLAAVRAGRLTAFARLLWQAVAMMLASA